MFFGCKGMMHHTVRNLHFLSKNSTLISRENWSIFWGWKTRENVVVWDFLAVDNFDFTRKIVKKKKFRENVGVFSKLNFLDKNLTFQIVCDDNTVVENGTKNETFFVWFLRHCDEIHTLISICVNRVSLRRWW